jgi:glutaminyl-peptide cyclotransferase
MRAAVLRKLGMASGFKGFVISMLLLILTSLHPLFAQTASKPRAPRAPEYTFKVVHAFPHDSAAFTQGLAYRDGFLFEGTGLKGASSLRKVRLQTGEVVKRLALAPDLFGEGITLYKDEIIQLTWLSQIGFVYDANDFRLLRRFSYKGEGWGLATNGAPNSNELFLSDGTSEIRVLDALTLNEKRRFTVRDGEKAIDQLNELEYVEGEIFANVWQSDRIARISPKTGKVLGWVDLTGLLNPMYRRDGGAVLNGIAYDAANKRLFVTGKLWPSVFEIRIIAKARK